MATDKFYIAPFSEKAGLVTAVKPFMIPDEAFSLLENAYVFRGRVRKRFGSTWMGNSQMLSRLRIAIGTTDPVTGVFSGTVPVSAPNTPIALPGIGQAFSLGTDFFTVNDLGTPATLLSSGTASTYTFNTTTGAVNITDINFLGTNVYYYPALPVMGLESFQNTAYVDEPLFAFDTNFAYQYLATGFERLATEAAMNVGASVWSGTNSDFFWGTSWLIGNSASNAFFVTNNNPTDGIRYLSGTSWFYFKPQIDAAGNILITAQIVVVFKNRLVAFNTTEGMGAPGVNFQNRCRYGAYADPTASNAWRQDIPGQGNYIDAATSEAIITVEFIKDKLIVYFEESTWELVYVGNQAYPFTWQKINTEFGAESTFSIVPFDQVALGIGQTGIIACNGSNVTRIDQSIPDEIFVIRYDEAGIFRVAGIRDYFVEMVYWTFPDSSRDATQPYPNKVLIYNYVTKTWAVNDDSITAFGYFQPTGGVTWDSMTITWDDTVSWDSGSLVSKFRNIAMGNQEGFVTLLNADTPTNAPALQITDIEPVPFINNFFTIVCIDHNFQVGDFIYISGVTQSTMSNLTLLNGLIYKVLTIVDANTFLIDYFDDVGTIVTGTYSGNGNISRVSKINIQTKEYNFYAESGFNAYIEKVDFMVDKTTAGQLQVNMYGSTNIIGGADNSYLPTPILGALQGNTTLDTFPYPLSPAEADAVRLWHPVYVYTEGNVVSLNISMTDDQMMSVGNMQADFVLHAMCIHASRANSRLQ